MKRAFLLLGILGLSGIGQAYAERGDQFWLLKGGMLWVSSDDPDTLNTLGLTYGYGITQGISLELDYDRSFAGGAYRQDAEKGEYKTWLISGNLAYRHRLYSDIYAKAKLGYSYGGLSRSSDTKANRDDAVDGVNGSLGLGYLAGALVGTSTTFELFYTRHTKDISSVMLGVNLTF